LKSYLKKLQRRQRVGHYNEQKREIMSGERERREKRARGKKTEGGNTVE